VNKFIFLSCLATVLFPASQALAGPRSVHIGTFTYLGTRAETRADGKVVPVSSYKLHLETAGITSQPISFRDAIIFIKGTKQDNGTTSTGFGCGQLFSEEQCNLIFAGGPSSDGFILAPCAKVNRDKSLTQNCISIGVQLVSSTGKNFDIALSNGEHFCAYAINNVFLLPRPNQAALDPRCDTQGFCRGASVPINLDAAPSNSCKR